MTSEREADSKLTFESASFFMNNSILQKLCLAAKAGLFT